MKTYEKFNKKVGKNYWQSFVQGDSYFYDKIGEVLKKYLKSGKKLTGLDVGCGPGIGAWLCNQNKLNVKILGIEPSDNWKEGQILAEKFNRENSLVEYCSKKGEMKDSKEEFNLKENSLDFVLFLRAAHEIMLSYKTYEEFSNDLKEFLKLLKKGGILILADPEYAEHINKNPEKYNGLINEIREYKKRTLGHAHVPTDYITADRIKSLFEGFVQEEKIILPNEGDLEYLKSKGFNLSISPTEFYIVCLRKT